MHSQKDLLFSKCRHNVECEKQRKQGTKFWQVLEVVCIDDNGDPHVSNGRGKNLGIFSLHRVELNPGGAIVGEWNLATGLVQ